ncbi:MAG: response regulator [Chloroflexota bacterium]
MVTQPPPPRPAFPESSTELVIVHADHRGRPVFVSHNIEALLGYPVQSWLEHPSAWTERVHPDDQARVTQARELSLATATDLDHEFRMRSATGEVLWLREVVYSSTDGTDRAPGRYGCLMALIRNPGDPGGGDAGATARTHERQHALSQIAPGVAHDLNQYLGLIAGHVDLMLRALDADSNLSQPARDELITVAQAARDAALAVTRLQRFAQPRSDDDGSVVSVADLLLDVAKLTAPTWRDASHARGYPITLEVNAPNNLYARASAPGLREALTSLILNACDALPGGGLITLAASVQDGKVQITVQDTGSGMSPDVQARAFDPYFSTKGAAGTGLGLSTARQLVEQDGGTLTIDPAVQRGTRLVVRLARADGPGDTAPVSSADERPAGSLRVLVVDDDPALARMTARMLSLDGHRASTASSGEQGLDALAAEPYDLVISDLGLGAGLNGWQLADEITRRWPNVRIVMITGWAAQIDAADAADRGIAVLLAKPFQLEELKSAVHRARSAPANP